MLGLDRKLRAKRLQRGDTLIEVLFAITVFSLIVVSSLALMNQGTAASQRSLEVTLVRQQIDSQAETLRFLQSSYVQNYYSGVTFNTSDSTTSPAEEYYKIIQRVQSTTSASAFGSGTCGTPPSNSFILNTRTARMESSTTLFKRPDSFAQVVYNSSDGIDNGGSQGIWIEGVRSPRKDDTSYIDFHIRACWDAPALDKPMNLGTIVRLYEPRG